jgi:hypothetical protein
MTSLIFVHGTGVRKGYWKDMEQIERALTSRRRDLRIQPGAWYPELGTRLHHNRRSIPPINRARSGTESEGDPVITLWAALYRDPFYELRLLPLITGAQSDVSIPGGAGGRYSRARNALTTLAPDANLQQQLEEMGIVDEFRKACGEVVSAAPAAVATAIDEPEVLLSRAVVARIIQRAQLAGNDTAVASDPDLRDELVAGLTAQLTQAAPSRSLARHIAQPFLSGGAHLATWFIGHKYEAAIEHFAFPFAGDILQYQRNGQPLRDFIRKQIDDAKPPVILLAHSLGGVACFDLLTLPDPPPVAGLITVGSQAPLLYELDVLTGLRAADSLRPDFPPWLNIYDPRDYLSFIASEIFPLPQVKDVPVNNRQPFPQAHSSYWSKNAQTWEAIVTWLDTVVPRKQLA